MIALIAAATIAAHLNPIAPDLPSREPQLAANASMVALVFGAGNSIYFSSSRDQGHTFSAPSKVDTTGVLPLSRHRGPRVALTGAAIVITAVAGTKADTGPH